MQTNKTRAFADHSDAAKYVQIDGGKKKKMRERKKRQHTQAKWAMTSSDGALCQLVVSGAPAVVT